MLNQFLMVQSDAHEIEILIMDVYYILDQTY